ncbi:hypothetical protein [Flavilitoribacter nigricans]|nr:hypothetical protein [Flavilitoribacter nigricans]
MYLIRFCVLGSLLLLCCFPNHLDAQEYLGNDLAFFAKKAELFQRWLDQKELGQFLSVDSVRVANNGYEVELFLQIPSSNPDSVAGIWRSLKNNYQANVSAPTLQESLFQTFVRFMEIDPTQGNVQIYMPHYDPGKQVYNSCFYIWLWQEAGRVKEDSKIADCKSQTVEIYIPMDDFSTGSGGVEGTLKGYTSSKKVFPLILEFARKKYEQNKPDCEGRKPTLVHSDKQSDFYLEFYVNDLCQEVLTDERQSIWCDFVELWWGPCNDMRRERLEFNINLSQSQKEVYLRIKITGKFGSGLYRPRKSGWMDMDPDFEDFLEEHAIIFKSELIEFLKRKRN